MEDSSYAIMTALKPCASSTLLFPHHILPVKSCLVNTFLSSCLLLFVQELAAEPRVRDALRAVYSGSATVTTNPTSAGMDHPSMEPWAK